MNVIADIINGKNVEIYLQHTVNNLRSHGAIQSSDMEILSLIKIYHPDMFCKYENEIISYMGLFYKELECNSLNELIFTSIKDEINELYGYSFTPVQAALAQNISDQKFFSFSAPTSTGKSFVLSSL